MFPAFTIFLRWLIEVEALHKEKEFNISPAQLRRVFRKR